MFLVVYISILLYWVDADASCPVHGTPCSNEGAAICAGYSAVATCTNGSYMITACDINLICNNAAATGTDICDTVDKVVSANRQLLCPDPPLSKDVEWIQGGGGTNYQSFQAAPPTSSPRQSPVSNPSPTRQVVPTASAPSPPVVPVAPAVVPVVPAVVPVAPARSPAIVPVVPARSPAVVPVAPARSPAVVPVAPARSPAIVPVAPTNPAPSLPSAVGSPPAAPINPAPGNPPQPKHSKRIRPTVTPIVDNSPVASISSPVASINSPVPTTNSPVASINSPRASPGNAQASLVISSQEIAPTPTTRLDSNVTLSVDNHASVTATLSPTPSGIAGVAPAAIPSPVIPSDVFSGISRQDQTTETISLPFETPIVFTPPRFNNDQSNAQPLSVGMIRNNVPSHDLFDNSGVLLGSTDFTSNANILVTNAKVLRTIVILAFIAAW